MSADPPPAAPRVAIRPALPADADALAALGAQVAAQPLLVRYGVTPAGLAAELRRLALLQPPAPEDPRDAVLHAPRLLVASAAGDPGSAPLRGFARFQRSGTLGAGGYLQLIAVAPGHEGDGLGSALLAGVEAAVAPHSPNLFLLTAEFNQGAQRFYQRHGYHRVGALPALARPDIVELLYWKRVR